MRVHSQTVFIYGEIAQNPRVGQPEALNVASVSLRYWRRRCWFYFPIGGKVEEGFTWEKNPGTKGTCEQVRDCALRRGSCWTYKLPSQVKLSHEEGGYGSRGRKWGGLFLVSSAPRLASSSIGVASPPSPSAAGEPLSGCWVGSGSCRRPASCLYWQ